MAFIRINNRKNFLLGIIPAIHPASAKYISWWRKEKKKIIEGYWGPDDASITDYNVHENPYNIDTKKWRFMPPQLYFYVNYGTILHKPEGDQKTAPKKPIRPLLRDIEWEFFYNWIEARGFSGFSLDDEYTCNLAVKKYLEDEDKEHLDSTCYKKDKTLKTFIPAREYIRSLFDKPLGVPLYMNEAKNLFMLGARGFGKDLIYNTLVHTDHGLEYIENINVGDKIYGRDGKLTDVVERTDYTDQEQYEIILDDGRSVTSGLGHIWGVYVKIGNRLEYKELELGDIINSKNTRGLNDIEYYIPQNSPVEYVKRPFKRHPYTTGFHVGNMKITKKIDNNYLYGSVQQRIDLLSGILDTSGRVLKNGYIEVETKFKNIYDTIVSLSRSLGIVTYTYKNKIVLKTQLKVFKFKDKLSLMERFPVDKREASMMLISDIRKKKVERSVCLGVNNEDNLFIVNDFVVTHNSYSVGTGVILHELLTDGAKIYNEESIQNPAMIEIFVGAALSSKSSDILAKTVLSFNELPGTWMRGTDDEIPCPLYKEMVGDLGPNNMKNPWRHEYEKKINGKWKKFGSKSNVKHGIYTMENPEAAAGGRYTVAVIEEVGLLPNVLTVTGGNNATQLDGTVKFGSSVYLGCVCEGTKVWTNNGVLTNIEDLKKEDGIIGYNSSGFLQQEIEKFTDPVEKPCYRITLEGGNVLECSEDHPILMSKAKMDKNINYETHKICTFREAKNIKNGDQLGTITSVPLFGGKHQQHARLLGLLVGDGYVGKWAPELSVDSEEVNSFITSNYKTRLKKEFMTKARYMYRSYNISNILELMRETGLYNKRKNDKILPLDIDSYDKNSLAEFIGGYFDADGSVKVGANGNVQIILTSNSKPLLEGIKYRLSKFGIESSIYLEKRRSGFPGGSENKYVLYVSRHGSVIKFAENIKFLTKRKQDKLEKVYKQILKKKSRTENKLLYVNGDDGNFFEGSKIVEEINFVTVKSVEFIGNKNVYNLTAGGTHSYLANNIITHNTGGNMEKIVESEIIFRDPEGFDFLAFDDEYEGKGKIGWFVPAYYGLNQYKDENGNTDVDKALKFILERRDKRRKAKSQTALTLEILSYPILPSEMFLKKAGNYFPIEDLKIILSDLETDERLLDSSWKGAFSITKDGEVKYLNSEIPPIRSFPLRRGEQMNGCVEIFEMPKTDRDSKVVSGRYILGSDPVDDDGNDDVSLSLQSSFVLDTFTDRIVAEYTARTEVAEEYYETLRRLAIFYNGRINYEQNKKGLFAYFKNKNSTYLLAETPQILSDTDLAKISNVGNKKYGTVASEKVNDWGRRLILSWLLNQAYGKEEGVVNMHTIRSVALLKELISWSKDINADRVSAMIMLMIYREEVIESVDREYSKAKEISQNDFWDKLFKNYQKRK